MFDILPILKPGMLIHIHDIAYPFEYQPDWITRENRSWNEAYLVRAFLQFNSAFKIVFFNHYTKRTCEAELRKYLPLFLNNCGGSLWIRRTR